LAGESATSSLKALGDEPFPFSLVPRFWAFLVLNTHSYLHPGRHESFLNALGTALSLEMYASIKSALILALLGFLLGSVDGFYYNLKPTAIHRQALRSKAPAQLVGVAEQQATSNVSFSFTSGLEIRRSLSLFSRQELQCEPGYCKNWRIHRLPLGLGDNLTVKLQTYALTIYVVRTVTTASPTAVAKAPTNSAAVVTAMTQRQRFAVRIPALPAK